MTKVASVASLLVILACAGCERQTTIPVAATEQPRSPSADTLATRIQVGMTRLQAKEEVEKLRPGKFLRDFGISFSNRYVRFEAPADEYLVLKFDWTSGAEPSDKVREVSVSRFSDLLSSQDESSRMLLRMIQRSPSINDRFSPLPLLRAVNALRPLGKDRALRVLRDYVTICNTDGDSDRKDRYGLDEQRVFLIARVLFVRKDHDLQMPWMYIGGTRPDVTPEDKAWPLFPLAMQDDLPFCLSSGYSLFGHAQSPLDHLNYCEKYCDIRMQPLLPTVAAPIAAERLFNSAAWKTLPQNPHELRAREFVRIQSIRAIAADLPPALRDEEQYQFSYGRAEWLPQKPWSDLLSHLEKQTFVWNSNTESYQSH